MARTLVRIGEGSWYWQPSACKRRCSERRSGEPVDGSVVVRARGDVRRARLRPRAHARRVAQELVDLALVAVLALAPGEQRGDAEVLGEAQHGLARREPVAVARRLEPPVVHAAAEAELLLHLRGDAHPEAPQRR